MTRIITQEDIDRIEAARSTSRETLERRATYGGRKGRSAAKRLKKNKAYR